MKIIDFQNANVNNLISFSKTSSGISRPNSLSVCNLKSQLKGHHFEMNF